MITPEQQQALYKASGVQGSMPQGGQQPANPVVGTGQNISNVLRTLGAGEIPMVGSALYEGGKALQSKLTGKNTFTPNSDPFSTDQQLQPFSNPKTAAQEAGGNILQGEAMAIGGANPLGMSGQAMLTRGGIGALSGLASSEGQAIKQGKNVSPVTGALSALLGGAGNVYIPPALGYLGGKAAQLAYGKAGAAIPDIAAETGQTITGSGSQGAKQAAQDIGGKIGDLYDQMGTGLTKDELFSMLDDTPVLDNSGASTPTNLDYFMRDAGIPAEDKSQVLNFIKTMGLSPQMRRSVAARAGSQASGAIEKEFTAALNQYVADNPDVGQQLTTQGIEGTSIPGGFWQDFKSAIKPSQKVYDQIAKSPDYVPGVEDKVRLQLSDAIANKLQDKLGEQSPEALSQLQNLNKLYGAAVPIAKGTARGALPYHLGIMAQLAAAGLLAAPVTGMKESPYLQMLAPLGFMANPAVSGAVASQMATPTTNAIVNALTSLGASNVAKKITH